MCWRGHPSVELPGYAPSDPDLNASYPYLLPPVLARRRAPGSRVGPAEPWACGRLCPSACLAAAAREVGAGGAQPLPPQRRSFRAVWPGASGGSRRETGPPVLLFLCLGGFFSVSAQVRLHFKVYNKCFG